MKNTRHTSVGRQSRRDVLKGAAVLAGLAAGSGLGPLRAADPVKVKIINPAGNFTLVAKVILSELKLYEKYGVAAEQIEVSDTNKILAGLISGEGDICSGSGFSALFPAIAKGATVKIVSGGTLAPTNILYTNKPDIKSVKDLPGRTVGTGAPGALLHELAVALMIKYGVDYKAVTFVNVGSGGDVFKALVAGTVEAGVAPIDFRDTAAEKFKVYPLADGQFWKEIPLFVNQALFASDKAIAEKRQGIVGVLAAYAELYRWIADAKNADAFLKYYARAMPNGSLAEGKFLREFVGAPGHAATDLVLSQDQLDYIQKLNVLLEVQKEVLPFDKCANMSLAQDALKLVKA